MSTSWNSVRPAFERAAIAHVATLLPDGSPHSVPVWVGVEGGDHLAIFMETDSLKDRNLRADPRIALSVTRPDEPLDMATVRGRVVQRVVGEAAMGIVDRIAQKYTGGPYDIRSGMTAFLIAPERYWANDYSGS